MSSPVDLGNDEAVHIFSNTFITQTIAWHVCISDHTTWKYDSEEPYTSLLLRITCRATCYDVHYRVPFIKCLPGNYFTMPMFRVIHPIELLFEEEQDNCTYMTHVIELSPYTEKLVAYQSCAIRNLCNVKYLKVDTFHHIDILELENNEIVSINANIHMIRNLLPVSANLRKVTCRSMTFRSPEESMFKIFSAQMQELFSELGECANIMRLSLHDQNHIPSDVLVRNLRVYKGPASRQFLQAAEKVGKLKRLEITNWIDRDFLALGPIVIRNLPLRIIHGREKMYGIKFLVNQPLQSVSNVNVECEGFPLYTEDEDL